MLPPETATFTSGHASHGVVTTVHHWQLRDLVSPGDTSDEFYTVYDKSVILHNCVTEESTTALNVDFHANCMTYAHGVLAAGGPNSQLVVKDVREKRIVHRGQIGGAVNNALHLAKIGHGLTLYVCNNDSTVKVFSLADGLMPTTTIRYRVPINYCALSPDGRRLSAVGDCETTLVHLVRESGYELEHEFREAEDSGMCTAWSSNGSCMASTHQDGTVAVWDIRCGGNIIQCYKLDSAVRNVKFSPGGVMDLLAFAEHEDLVHLVDMRQWTRAQHLNAGCEGGHEEGHGVSGICFSNRGDRLFVGCEHDVITYDLDSAGRRSFASGALNLR